MPAPITFTLDLEDHRPDESAELRYPEVTRRLLAQLDGWGVTGTFFVVGVVAQAQPELVRAIAAAGHEVALHGWEHIPLTELDPTSLATGIRRGKALLEDLTGTEVVGFRAPTFSLTAATTWATDVLTAEGFTYSSSVLPTANPLHGFPGAPLEPFLWPSGLAELPVPIAGPARARIPYLGGTYLRILPRPVIERARRAGTCRVPWTYLHPYDVDTGEPFWWVPDAGRLAPLLWVGRSTVLDKLAALVTGSEGAGPPLRERLADAALGGTFTPPPPGPAADRPTTPATPRAVDALAALADGDGSAEAADEELSHGRMMHPLPKARLVHRLEHLTDLAAGKRVIHVGFVDAGCRTMQDRAGSWLHGHLAEVAAELVGIDVDETGVRQAVASGFDAHVADARDPAAVAALELKPADLVIAGEVIEHLDDPGAFLAGLHGLVAPGGEVVISTPNAYGLFNVFASLARREINHPDHVVMFTWRTLTTLAARHGWVPVATKVYVPTVKDLTGTDLSATVLGLCAGVVVGVERAMTRLGRPYAADGLIITFRSTLDADRSRTT